MDYNIINKKMSISEIKERLNVNGIRTPYGWEIILSQLFEQCDYIKIKGHGSKAVFELVCEERP